MRARSIKPGFYKNSELADCSLAARLLAPGLWMLADREGRLFDRPKQIKGEVFPYDNFDVDALLNELAAVHHITRYIISGAKCIQIECFKEHQFPHHREKQSVIPSKSPRLTRGKAQPRNGPAHLNPESLILNPESIDNRYPDWLPMEDWFAFIEMRKSIGKTMTERAEQMIIKKLPSFKGSPSAVLQQSIINNWQDVFELRQNKYEKPVMPKKNVLNANDIMRQSNDA